MGTSVSGQKLKKFSLKKPLNLSNISFVLILVRRLKGTPLQTVKDKLNDTNKLLRKGVKKNDQKKKVTFKIPNTLSSTTLEIRYNLYAVTRDLPYKKENVVKESHQGRIGTTFEKQKQKIQRKPPCPVVGTEKLRTNVSLKSKRN